MARVAGATLVAAIVILATAQGSPRASAAPPRAAPPCDNYYSDVTPPENIGVGITDATGVTVIGVVYRDFKTYVKDVLPNEWLADWQPAAYQAGALAVKTYGWYYVNHWAKVQR
jgi:hypothetical protein